MYIYDGNKLTNKDNNKIFTIRDTYDVIRNIIGKKLGEECEDGDTYCLTKVKFDNIIDGIVMLKFDGHKLVEITFISKHIDCIEDRDYYYNQICQKISNLGGVFIPNLSIEREYDVYNKGSQVICVHKLNNFKIDVSTFDKKKEVLNG